MPSIGRRPGLWPSGEIGALRDSNYLEDLMLRKGNSLLKTLWQRKLFYICGYFVGLLLIFLNKILGSKVNFSDFFVMPFACSPVFGFILYLVKKEPERLKREGRIIIFSKEGLVHMGLSFAFIIIYGILIKIINKF